MFAMPERGSLGRRIRILVALCGVALCAVSVTGCSDEARAQRLYDDAMEHVEQDRLDEAIALFRRIESEFPETRAAARATENIETYSDLSDAEEVYPSRKAYLLLVDVARKLERYRSRHGRAPGRLEDLGADVAFVDPWGRALTYRPQGKGYELACLGEDGVPGGEGDSADMVVRNGTVVEGRWR